MFSGLASLCLLGSKRCISEAKEAAVPAARAGARTAHGLRIVISGRADPARGRGATSRPALKGNPRTARLDSVHTTLRIALGVGSGLLLAWIALAAVLIASRPERKSLAGALRLLPDTLRLFRRLAGDPLLPRGVRARLWLLFVYVAIPFDLIPDFIPVIGYADDAIIACIVLRFVVRRAGPEAVRRHWPGTPEGLAALWKVARLPGSPTPPPTEPGSTATRA
jgi:uncharacterized membrane protein YkvA (DUF1232 family)